MASVWFQVLLPSSSFHRVSLSCFLLPHCIYLIIYSFTYLLSLANSWPPFQAVPTWAPENTGRFSCTNPVALCVPSSLGYWRRLRRSVVAFGPPTRSPHTHAVHSAAFLCVLSRWQLRIGFQQEQPEGCLSPAPLQELPWASLPRYSHWS